MGWRDRMTRDLVGPICSDRRSPAGICVWCHQAIVGPTGQPRRARWHTGDGQDPNCLLDYQVARGQAAACRAVCRERDQRVCRLCGRDCRNEVWGLTTSFPCG